jgi:putative methyltransferase
MKRCYLHIPQPNVDKDFIVVPYLWLQFKQYYDQFSPHASSWDWVEPEIYPRSNDQIIEYLSIFDTLDVVGVSQYMWTDERSLHELCIRIKQKFPSCVIVFGGPQPNVLHTFDYFRKHPHIDAVCDQASYGEWFWTAVLDQIARGTLDMATIPHAIYPNRLRMKAVSPIEFEKRQFKWAQNPFGTHRTFMDKFFDYAASHNLRVKATIEFSRGCPYTCTYCDWGGGIGTKVVFRPIEYVYQDLECLMQYDVTVLNIMDANFGIVARDVDILRKIIELRDKYRDERFHLTLLGLAKAKKDYVNQILLIGAQANIIHEHFISAQSLNETTLRAIKRTDAPWRQQIQDLQPLRLAYPDFPIALQVILGLPESTLDDFYTWLDVVQQHNLSLIAAIWALLPATPAHHPEYIQQYDLKVRSIKVFMHSTLSRRVKIEDIDHKAIVVSPIVVQSSTYTQDEWEEMYLLSILVPTCVEVKWFKKLFTSIQQRTQLPASILYRSFLTHVLKDPTSPLHLWYTSFNEQLRNSMNNTSNCALDAFVPPTPDGYVYCGEAYWIHMMSSDPQWTLVARAWATSVIYNAFLKGQ